MGDLLRAIGQTLQVVLGLLWFGSGIAGLIWIVRKGYFPSLGNLGCTFWILGGWLGLLIGAYILVLLGPILLLIAWRLTPKVRCPFCNEKIYATATKCPHCQADLVPAVEQQDTA